MPKYQYFSTAICHRLNSSFLDLFVDRTFQQGAWLRNAAERTRFFPPTKVYGQARFAGFCLRPDFAQRLINQIPVTRLFEPCLAVNMEDSQ